jgi:hypothetical protein
LSLLCGPSGLRSARSATLVPKILQEGQKAGWFAAFSARNEQNSWRAAARNPQMLGFARPSVLLIFL